VDAPTRTDPPYVPIRHTRWPVRRTPFPAVVAVVVVLAGVVLVALAHKPSQAQRAADLRGFARDMNTRIESCAGGVRDSLTALHEIESGASHEVATASGIASFGAANCSPGNNQQLEDLTQYQVTESLAGFHLRAAVDDLVTWAFPLAQQVQEDVVNRLAAQGQQAKAQSSAALQQALRKLDVQRAAIDAMMRSASTSVSANAPLPALPG